MLPSWLVDPCATTTWHTEVQCCGAPWGCGVMASRPGIDVKTIRAANCSLAEDTGSVEAVAVRQLEQPAVSGSNKNMVLDENNKANKKRKTSSRIDLAPLLLVYIRCTWHCCARGSQPSYQQLDVVSRRPGVLPSQHLPYPWSAARRVKYRESTGRA